MENTNHSQHTDYSKPEDQCLECQKEMVELREEIINVQIDQALEDREHHHGGHR